MSAATNRANPTVLGIIPARGGSKGLPHKNILPLAGKPLIAYTIKAALETPRLDEVLVSTDDELIAEVAREYGADVPFRRPADLAEDDTLTFPVLVHALDWLAEQRRYHPDYVMVLQPTSPLRSTGDIEAALDIAITTRADTVVSVSRAYQHPYWMKQITEDGRLINYLSAHLPCRRQELPQVYALNGAIYLAESRILMERRTFYTERTYAYIMPPERSLDIDSQWDLYLAELVLKDGMKRA